MKEPDEMEMAEAVAQSVPLAVIYIRMSKLGPIVVGGPINETLDDRELVTDEGSKIVMEAFNQGVEAVLKVMSNAPGGVEKYKPPVGLTPKSKEVVSKLDLEKDLDYFDQVKVIEDE